MAWAGTLGEGIFGLYLATVCGFAAVSKYLSQRQSSYPPLYSGESYTGRAE